MNISNDSQQRIVDEINYVLENMGKTANPQHSLYYFSAVHGIINRIMNFECDPALVFAHLVLSATHTTFVGQLSSIAERPNGAKTMLELLNMLKNTLSHLAPAFQNRDDSQIHQVLQQFANIAYALTGNGYYLYIKGKLDLKGGEEPQESQEGQKDTDLGG